MSISRHENNQRLDNQPIENQRNRSASSPARDELVLTRPSGDALFASVDMFAVADRLAEETNLSRLTELARFGDGKLVVIPKGGKWNEQVIGRLCEVLPFVESPPTDLHGRVYMTVHFHEVIGADRITTRLPEDKVTYVQLRSSGNWVPVAPIAEAERLNTKSLSFVVSFLNSAMYRLHTAGLGLPAVHSPTDRAIRDHQGLRRRSVSFWEQHVFDRHALVAQQQLVFGSEARDCPWDVDRRMLKIPSFRESRGC